MEIVVRIIPFSLTSRWNYYLGLLQVAYHPLFKHPLPEGHRFPMEKYELIPAQLRYEGVLDDSNFFLPEPAGADTIKLAHDANYCEDLLSLNLDPRMVRRIGFPLTAQLVERELRIVQGTIMGCRMALEAQVAFNVAGGTHHAGSDWGEGFCLLNDQAVAAAYLLHHRLRQRILIIDLDVHQGNGTAEIFEDEPRVFTFSMHGAHNFPFRKERSDRDVGLEAGVGDADYMAILDRELSAVFASFRPDFVFYQAGVDVLATDRLGKLALTAQGCRQRDERVFAYCKAHGVPVQVSMGGGYSPELRHIVDAHCQTFKAAISIFY